MRILVVEDEAETAEALRQGLQEAGHSVRVARDGCTGLFLAAGEDWDLLIMERRLPRLNGLKLLRTLRAGGALMPVLFLSAAAGVDDRVAGLNAGADDYLAKPFAFAELAARVRALHRRQRVPAPAHVLRVADIEMDLLARSVRRGADPIELAALEFRLLEYLMRHAEKIVTRGMLLQHVWALRSDPRTKLVETSISRLRGKIDRGRNRGLIRTVRGAGYCLDSAEAPVLL